MVSQSAILENKVNKCSRTSTQPLSPQEKNKNTYLAAMDMFHEMTVHKRGHVEFIYAALREMETFGVHKDLEAYKKVLGVFPVGQMVSTNIFQVRTELH